LPRDTDYGLSTALTAAQTSIVHSILQQVIPTADVRVFGSRATGRARPFSDLDLLVVHPPRLSWEQLAELRDLFEASDLQFRVDVVEAAALPAGIAERVRLESVPLPDL
jgi:uncharacterized protein